MMTELRALYAEYLRSQEWADRRAKVMARANHLCEGCRERKASEVHHLSYENITREFLFELVALCTPCHERIHGLPAKPSAANWMPCHTSKPVADSPRAKVTRERLAALAAEHRAKTMAAPLPDPLPPAEVRLAELAEARRTGKPAPEWRDIPEGEAA